MNELSGKTAYITGGSKGIGLGIAKSLIDTGMNIAITSRTLSAAEKAAASVTDDSSRVLAIESDVSSLTDEMEAVEKVIDKFGGVDVLIANAGVGHFVNIEEMSEETWREMIDTNLTGVFNSVKACLPSLKKSKGYIITMASLAGTNFFENGSAYNASKFGLVGFSQAIMLDLRKLGIKVTTIMPGSVSTYFNDRVPGDSDQWKIQPEDIGQMVVDLLEMHPRTLPSKIEVRPSLPPK